MKKVFLAVFIIGCIGTGFAQNEFPINESIENAADFLNQRIPAGTSVAVFNFSSDSKKLSDYIIDELTTALVNVGVNVYDRNNLDEVNREIYYGFTGAVDDNTAQSYGHDIGVKTVILGSITASSNNVYRLRIQAIEVETKRVQAGGTFNIVQDEQLLALLDIRIQMEHRFTTPRKMGFGFKNMLFGLGSFQMEDLLGGGITVALEIASVGVIAYGFFHNGSVALRSIDDWANATSHNVYDDRDEYDSSRRLAFGIIAGGAAGMVLTWTWGFIRPFMYDKPVPVQRLASVIDHLNIGVIPMSRGETKVTVSLNYSF
jgi:hypothetical protein